MDDRPRDRALQPVRDLDLALAAVGGDRGLADDLFASLLDALPVDLGAMRTSYDASDWRTLADQAHRLRGATRYCGVPRLDRAAEALERTAVEGVPEEVLARLLELEDEAVQLSEAHQPPDP